MTFAIWISIAAIIVPSAITVITSYWQVRTARDIANAGQKTPQDTANKSAFSYRFRNSLAAITLSPWYVPMFMVVFNALSLTILLRSAAPPLTRRAVFDISIAVAGICYGFALNLINAHRRITAKQFDVTVKLADGFHILTDFVGTLSKDLKAMKDMRLTPELLESLKQLQEVLARWNDQRDKPHRKKAPKRQ